MSTYYGSSGPYDRIPINYPIVTPGFSDVLVYDTPSVPCNPIYTDGTFWIYFIVVLLLLVWGWALSRRSTPWYQGLNQPSFRPPSYFFTVIWVILYFLLAFSTYLGVRSADPETRRWINLAFAVNVVLNFAWIYAFFVAKNLKVAFWILLLLLLSTLWLMYLVFRVNPMAGGILLLYFIWLVVAAAYNWQLISLNPTGGVNTTVNSA